MSLTATAARKPITSARAPRTEVLKSPSRGRERTYRSDPTPAAALSLRRCGRSAGQWRSPSRAPEATIAIVKRLDRLMACSGIGMRTHARSRAGHCIVRHVANQQAAVVILPVIAIVADRHSKVLNNANAADCLGLKCEGLTIGAMTGRGLAGEQLLHHRARLGKVHAAGESRF